MALRISGKLFHYLPHDLLPFSHATSFHSFTNLNMKTKNPKEQINKEKTENQNKVEKKFEIIRLNSILRNKKLLKSYSHHISPSGYPFIRRENNGL